MLTSLPWKQLADKQVGLAFLKAILFYFVFYYVIVTHIYVFYHWNNPKLPSVPNLTRSTTDETLLNERLSTVHALLEQQEQLGRRIHNSRDMIITTKARLYEMEPFTLATGRANPSQTEFQQFERLAFLLDHLPDLGQRFRSIPMLRQAMRLAVSEIQTVVALEKDEQPNAAIKDQWSHIQAFFQQRRDALANLSWNNNNNNSNVDTCPQTVTMSQVQQLEANLRNTLQNRHKLEWNVVLPTTAQRINATLDRLVQFTVDQVVSLKQIDTSTSNTDCVRNDQVVPWIHAGLDALYRKKDLRVALLEALKNDGIDTSKIILDAPLPPEKDPEWTIQQTINLRRLLDRPLTKQVAKWIDQAVDAVSGHSDRFDRLVDGWHVQGGMDPGRMVVERMLELAGNIPIPKSVQKK